MIEKESGLEGWKLRLEEYTRRKAAEKLLRHEHQKLRNAGLTIRHRRRAELIEQMKRRDAADAHTDPGLPGGESGLGR